MAKFKGAVAAAVLAAGVIAFGATVPVAEAQAQAAKKEMKAKKSGGKSMAAKPKRMTNADEVARTRQLNEQQLRR